MPARAGAKGPSPGQQGCTSMPRRTQQWQADGGALRSGGGHHCREVSRARKLTGAHRLGSLSEQGRVELGPELGRKCSYRVRKVSVLAGACPPAPFFGCMWDGGQDCNLAVRCQTVAAEALETVLEFISAAAYF